MPVVFVDPRAQGFSDPTRARWGVGGQGDYLRIVCVCVCLLPCVLYVTRVCFHSVGFRIAFVNMSELRTLLSTGLALQLGEVDHQRRRRYRRR